MPQQPRLPEEDEEFATMLSGINVIYLGMKVPKHFKPTLFITVLLARILSLPSPALTLSVT